MYFSTKRLDEFEVKTYLRQNQIYLMINFTAKVFNQ